MSKMLTDVARMIRTGGMKGFTPRAKLLLKKEANRSERRAPLPFEEYGTESDDIVLDSPFYAAQDEECTFCKTKHPTHRMVHVKRFEPSFCDCCPNWEWAPYCYDCAS